MTGVQTCALPISNRSGFVLGVKYKVSLTIDGEDSEGILERSVSVCNPCNGLFSDLVIPNSNIAITGTAGAEKPKCKVFLV